MSYRSRICLALLITAVVVCAAAASASATTYCVNDTACVAAGGMVEPDLQTALNLSATGTNAIHLGAGLYVGSTVTTANAIGFWYQGAPNASVSITGAGEGLTVLVGPGGAHATDTVLRIDGTSIPAASVSDLSIRRPVATGSSVGLGMYDPGTVSHVDIADADGAQATAGYGLDAQASSVSVTDCSISVGGAARAAFAHTTGTALTLDRCRLNGGVAAYAAASTTLSVLRSTLMPVGAGAATGNAISDFGTAIVRDSLIELTAQSQNGIFVASGASSSSSADISNTTISGREFGDTGGVQADGSAGGAGQTVTVTFDSSIARDANIDLIRSPAMGGGVTFTATESAFSTLLGLIAKGTTDFDRTLDPQFVDPAHGNFHLSASSPLIDIGSTGTFTNEPATDLAGTLRVLHGRRDVGAYEYGFATPTADARASASLGSIGAPFTFDASASSDPDPGDALTFTWGFDDGTTATGGVVAHGFATPGAHSGTVTVTDPRGLSATATAFVLVAFPDLGTPPPPFRGVLFSQTKTTLSSTGHVGVTLRCPSTTSRDCRGTLTMTATLPKTKKKTTKTHAKAKPVKVASATFTIATGKSKSVTLKLSAAALAAIRATHKLTGLATAVAHDGAGVSATTRRSLSIAQAPKKHVTKKKKTHALA